MSCFKLVLSEGAALQFASQAAYVVPRRIHTRELVSAMTPLYSVGLLWLWSMAIAMAMAMGEEESGLCLDIGRDGVCKGSAGESLFVDGAKLQEQIDELAAFSDTPSPSVTRILFSDNDVAARR